VSTRTRRHKVDTGYPLRFGAAAFLFIAVTLVLVLFVIPERYVLSPGFRESSIRFPPPTTPFAPVSPVAVPARPRPAAPDEVLPGPAEILWDQVTPLLEEGRYASAVPVFERYLARYPSDTDVRRELAVSLLLAGRVDEAVKALRTVLEKRPDRELALLLARTLRDAGRLTEASIEYGLLAAEEPDDEALALEWAQAHAWASDYERAVEILTSALARHPDSISLQLELVRVYYALGRGRDALALLADMQEGDLTAFDGRALEASVLMSHLSVVPATVPAPAPPTVLERTMSARLAGDLQRARTLLEDAIAAMPEDRDLRLTYADLLEYELGELEGARAALLEAERLGALDPVLQLRLARLDIWAGRSGEAEERLEELLAAVDRGAIGSANVSRAEVLSLLGDLRRWAGDRRGAARRYEQALADDPEDQRARGGLEALELEIARELVALENPGVSGIAYSLADSDGFLRVDAGASWSKVTPSQWVWRGAVGQRWLEGYDLSGVDALGQGVFADVELARWWRWGALRTGLDFGAQQIRGDWDARIGASLRHRGGSASDTELRIEHAPAHPLANTLQSVLAEVVHDRLSLTHARRLGARWSLSASFDAARLQAEGGGATVSLEASERVEVTLSAGRAMSESLSLGLATRALTFLDAAPLALPAGASARPLFWDPNWSISTGPYARVDRELGPSWHLVGRLNPGLALVDERRSARDGIQVVPHASLEAGLRHEGRRLSTSFELFYYQGQFDGYRSYGARVRVGARDLSLGSGAR
jgi:tetratricopeptide (TPR) repeat protein